MIAPAAIARRLRPGYDGERLIGEDTPLLPEIVADGVVAEAEKQFGVQAGRATSDRLADVAERLYFNGRRRRSHFVRQIRAAGNRGRDNLYMYMRHWIHHILVFELGVPAKDAERFYQNGG